MSDNQTPQKQSTEPIYPTPASPAPENNAKKIGSLVERLRSYESDVARLKGVPLAPVVLEKTVEIRATVPPPNPYDIAGKPEPYVEAMGNTSQSLDANNTIVSDIVKEDPQIAIDALHKESPIQNFRTIQTDTATASTQKKETPEEKVVEDIIEAEKNHKTVNQQIVVEDPKRSFYVLMLSGILLGGGALALAGFYLVKSRPTPPPTIIIDKNNIITTEKTLRIELSSSETLLSQILASKETTIERNTIAKLNIYEASSTNLITAEKFVTNFSPTVPVWLARSLDPTYLTGIHATVNGTQPLFIFKIDSYENGYAGMLKWEETMADEFKDFFPQKNESIIPVGFRDVIIKNKDARVLMDGSGRRLILYSFWDPTTLVITTSQATLEEVFARLITSKFVR